MSMNFMVKFAGILGLLLLACSEEDKTPTSGSGGASGAGAGGSGGTAGAFAGGAGGEAGSAGQGASGASVSGLEICKKICALQPASLQCPGASVPDCTTQCSGKKFESALYDKCAKEYAKLYDCFVPLGDDAFHCVSDGYDLKLDVCTSERDEVKACFAL